MNTEQTEEDVQALLAGEAVRGPRMFRGRELAPLSRGLRSLHGKILRPGDTDGFHDVALMYVLTEAHAVDDAKRLENRRRLIIETDDVATFRAHLTLFMDTLEDEDMHEAKRLTDELFELVEKAKVKGVAEKKPLASEELAERTAE